ncbi:biotin/lipoyl-containing protein, partial [Salinibacterium sp.]|uniref:biotin/lipoyl-containing protein n=1 Tax=Salinibacterium sp. TaxID=1915057 RepID=UPI00286D6547
MADSDFTLPDVGEGLTEAEIVSWKVKAGDTVTVNQVLVEIETAKSLVELPSPFAGMVTALLVEEGQTVEVGTPIISVSSNAAGSNGAGSGGAHSSGATPDSVNADSVSADGVESTPTDGAGESLIADTAATIASPEEKLPEEKSGAVLVGYGVSGHGGSRRRGATAPPVPPVTSAAPPRPSSVPAAAASVIIAKPPIRKLAKDLGVDLA